MNKTLKAAAAAAVTSSLMASTALADGIITQSLTFESNGAEMSGTLYLPADFVGEAMPTVIVTGAWTTVQHQMPAAYAREIGARGFAAFTFDFRGWGQSGDLPQNVRFREDPAAKTADIEAAISFVAALPEVDAEQIHGLGICASAGYMVDAVSGNPLIQSVGLVAPWLQNEAIVDAVYGGEDGMSGLIELSRQAEVDGGMIIPAAGPEGAEGVLMPLGGYYYEADRGAIPEYDNQWNHASWEGWLTYYPADHGGDLDKPLAIVHSEAAAIPDGVRIFLQGFAGDATMRWLEDVTQFDFYDVTENITQAADTMAEHFSS